MDATVKWSLSLLPSGIRKLIDVLAVVPSSFTVETATELVRNELPRETVVSSLEQLVGYALVERVTTSNDERMRWRLLRTVRVVVLEQLENSWAEAVQSAYADQLCSWTLQTEKELYNTGQNDARRSLAGELESIRWMIQRFLVEGKGSSHYLDGLDYMDSYENLKLFKSKGFQIRFDDVVLHKHFQNKIVDVCKEELKLIKEDDPKSDIYKISVARMVKALGLTAGDIGLSDKDFANLVK